MNKKNLIQSLFGVTTLLVALGYLLSVWYANPVMIEEQLKSTKVEILAISTVLSIFAGLFNARLWFKINYHLDETINFSTSYWAWSVGRIYRYIPGKVAGYYIRNKLQKSPIKIGISASISEFILILLPILFLVIIYLATSTSFIWFVLPLLLLFLGLYFIKPILMVFPKITEQFFYSPKEVTDKLRFILPAMLLHGLSFYLIIKVGLSENSISLYQAVLALYISGIVGQLALIVPGGIGVREAAIVVLLTTFGINTDVAISAAIISRVTLLFSELCNVTLAFICKQGQSK
ncbi:lysylphosphatidylglycerol synthase domain-containing protein [Colwellia sp. 12G3]|uniref:lysylphosphatidylglycerol synthase domain-containing protein n=1 Tax=Colwellia sp. 12G3 TaxID=2058299 RepID=UPI000C347227|nr:lysylphosphatidylglycerol synthase domain-containing protein [Colwellia sp. 12G3]PKI13057.1 hypothetical protein CXF71_20370 [Colwellia sp. 12G3]